MCTLGRESGRANSNENLMDKLLLIAQHVPGLLCGARCCEQGVVFGVGSDQRSDTSLHFSSCVTLDKLLTCQMGMKLYVLDFLRALNLIIPWRRW